MKKNGSFLSFGWERSRREEKRIVVGPTKITISSPPKRQGKWGEMTYLAFCLDYANMLFGVDMSS